MTARHVANEAALRDVIADALHADVDGDFLVAADGWGEDIALSRAGIADAVRWAVNAVTPVFEDAVREAKAEALREAAQAIPPYDAPDSARRWLRHRAAALTRTTPGTDRPAAEDGPRNTGRGSAT